MKKQWVILIVFQFLFSWKAVSQYNSLSGADSNWISEQERNYYSQSMGFELPLSWNKSLYDTIENWMGTPYCFAGNSKNGVDCSGFVNALYFTVYKMDIGARNSGDIYKKITKVDKDDLSEGDLVFFRIRSKRRISHVGMYLGNNKFIHASTSSGVIVSDLNEPYYRKYFAGGGHLPAATANDQQ